MRASPFCVVAVLTLAVGCQKKEERPPSATSSPAAPAIEAPPPEPAQTVRRTPENMRDHFTSGVLVRDALIAGDLALAQWNATWLAEREPEPAIAEWGPSVTELRARARAVAAAPDLERAAAAAADLALECGRCHQANGVSPRFVVADVRVPASGPGPHMLEHQWAAERLWEGLIGANAETWTRGVAELAGAPLGQDEIFPNASATQRITKLAADVHALGAEGGKAQTWPARATVYGRLLATCATCHTETVSR